MIQTTQTMPLEHRQSILRDSIQRHSVHPLVEFWNVMSARERFMTVGLAIREQIDQGRLETSNRYKQANTKMAYYLSMEFLIGRALVNNLINLGLYEDCKQVLADMGEDITKVVETERDAALGNGGLGRLAACFLDSLATLNLPGYGYGINYEYGLFKQEIRDGRQVERPDSWLTYGSPWLVSRPEMACTVRLYGRVINAGTNGQYDPRWVDCEMLLGIPNDMPIVGYGGKTVNTLRLYSARALEEFDMETFNEGEFLQAVHEKVRSETICKVLYPNDHVTHGPELRLIQEYFLVACAIDNILDRFNRNHPNDWSLLPEKVAIQLNDTHPALSVAELMRVLVDDHKLAWEKAWELTQACCAYTNHTLMPEALEKWPVHLFERVLPRHLQIIYEINRRHLDRVAHRFPNDINKLKNLSIILEGPTQMVRMANLAIVGSHSVNGVAAVHSQLVKTNLVPDFYALDPQKFNNKTNGVTPRRWIVVCNPGLTRLLTEAVGDRWITDLDQLRAIEPLADDSAFCDRFLAIKMENKDRLAKIIQTENGVSMNLSSMIDVQVKRIHLYKRQLLNILHVVHDYLLLTEDHRGPIVPKTYVFAGKAAPSYWLAKEVIYLINKLADLINHDPRCRDHLQLVFARDYRVTLSEKIIPAADLSEQVSTAGTEASGTGNMKFSMNGALTVGTLDGANIEIREEVGAENFFLFGNTVPQINDLQVRRVYPRSYYDNSPVIQRILNAFRGDRLSPGNPGRFEWVFQTLVESWDPYFHLADLESYLQAQDQATQLYSNRRAWARKAILNVARMGKFSSDRTISEYAREIWNVKPVL